MIVYHLELAARAHGQELRHDAHNARQARLASRDGHTNGRHQLVTVVLAVLLGTALLFM